MKLRLSVSVYLNVAMLFGEKGEQIVQLHSNSSDSNSNMDDHFILAFLTGTLQLLRQVFQTHYRHEHFHNARQSMVVRNGHKHHHHNNNNNNNNNNDNDDDNDNKKKKQTNCRCNA